MCNVVQYFDYCKHSGYRPRGIVLQFMLCSTSNPPSSESDLELKNEINIQDKHLWGQEEATYVYSVQRETEKGN